MAINKSDYRQVFTTAFTEAEDFLFAAKQNHDALSQYLKSWQDIAEKAASLNNPALHDVVVLFVDAVDSAFKKTIITDSLLDTQWQLLKKWNRLFDDYINAPDNQESVLALIQCLNDRLLAMELSWEDEEILLDSFLPVIEQLIADNKQDVIPYKDSQKLQLSTWDKVTILMAETEAFFQELLQKNHQYDEREYAEAVKHYLNGWKIIAELITSEQDEPIVKILDVISLLVTFSCQLFTQTERLNTEQQDVLQQWHHLFSSYIKTEGSQQLAIALIKLLTMSVWPQPISDNVKKILMSEFQPQNSSSLLEPALQPLPVIKKLSFWQELELFFKETVPPLKAAAEQQSSDDKVALKTSLQHYLEAWLALAQQIDINGEQNGLLDVVLLYIEVSRLTFLQLNSFEKAHITLLNKWQNLFSSYLKAKGNKQLMFSLIKCLRDSLWQGALDAADEKMLLEGLTITNKPNLPIEKITVLAKQAIVVNESTVSSAGFFAEPKSQQVVSFADEKAEDLSLFAEDVAMSSEEELAISISEDLEAIAVCVPNEKVDELLRLANEISILNEKFKERIQRFSEEFNCLNQLTWHIQSLVAEFDHAATNKIAEAAIDIRAINHHIEQQFLDLKYLMIEEEMLQKENQAMVESIRKTPTDTLALLLVKCGGQTLAISNRGLSDIHQPNEYSIVQENEKFYCNIENERYLGKHFAKMLNLPMTNSMVQTPQALCIEDEINNKHVIFVDEVLGYQNLWVKTMGRYIPAIQGVLGASILGNGEIAPVIDVMEMLNQ